MKKRIANTVMHHGKRIVCKIYDNGGATMDRYTVVLRAFRYDGILVRPYYGCSDCPEGMSYYGEFDRPFEGNHLGKRVAMESLPEAVQLFIQGLLS